VGIPNELTKSGSSTENWFGIHSLTLLPRNDCAKRIRRMV